LRRDRKVFEAPRKKGLAKRKLRKIKKPKESRPRTRPWSTKVLTVSQLGKNLPGKGKLVKLLYHKLRQIQKPGKKKKEAQKAV